MPDGQRLISNPMGLSFFDYSSDKSILLAEVTNCIGELVAPNVVVYASAFDSLKSALRYTYTRDGFEQDVILYENPGSPADYGLNPDTTLLEMYSEFFNPPVPMILSSSDNDQTLNFGQMQMVRGQAYFLNEALQATDVAKTCVNIDGRTFLVESVPYPAVRPMLEKLALAQGQASNPSAQDRKGLVGALRPREKPMRVASIKPAKSISHSGLLIDFVTKNSNLTNFTWLGDTTYFISGNVGLFGTNTIFEGGAVLKYTNNVSVTVNTPLTWQGSSYRPVVLTARDDGSVGESITPTNALSGYYATVALVLDGNAANTNFVLQNLRVANAQTAIAINGKSGHAISHAQLVTCQNGFSATNADFSLRNALFDHALTNFNGSSSTGRIEHLTVDTASWLNNSIGTNLYLTNCLLVSVTNTGSIGGSNTVYSTSSSGVFKTILAGSHYLADNTYRNVGTTNVNGALLSDLRNSTTYPPIQLTNAFTVNTTLSPQAQRDTDTLDAGFHYWPLDYIWTSLDVTNATLTLTNGVAVGSYGPKLVTLKGTGAVVSEGKPQTLNRLVTFHMVQEQPQGWITNTASMTLIGGVALTLRFTDVSFMAAALGGRYLSGSPFNSTITIQDSQLRGIYSYFYTWSSSGDYNPTYVFRNNILERCKLDWTQGYNVVPFDPYYLYITARNNFFTHSTVTLGHYGAYYGNWDIYDNLFDNSTISLTEYDPYNQSGAGGALTTADYNGYLSTSGSLGGSHNKTALIANYLAGPLGSYYYPTNGATNTLTALINSGSQNNAALVGLFHYTTTTDQVKEQNTVLDIGFHYVAVDGNGNPLDYDGDGPADYFEDRNGNGTVDTGETDWESSTDLGLKVWITEPKNNSNVP